MTSGPNTTSASGSGDGPDDEPTFLVLAAYCAVLGMLLAVAVTVVCAAVLCHRKRERRRHYYTASTPRKGHFGDVAGDTGEEAMAMGEGRDDGCTMGEGQEMEREEESEAMEQERKGGGTSHGDDQKVTRAASDNEQDLLSPEFVFEDGSALQNYPSSDDLEVMSDTGSIHRAHRDIYNSWILHADDTQHQEHLKECSSEKSTTCSQANESSIPALVVPQTNAWGKGVGSSQISDKMQVMPPASLCLEEAQESIDKSVAELLELSKTLSQEAMGGCPSADLKDKGYPPNEYQSLCSNESHKATPHVLPYHGSVPSLSIQAAEEDTAVRTLSSPSPSIPTHAQRMQATRSLVLEQKELTPGTDIQNTPLSTAESEDLLLISHV